MICTHSDMLLDHEQHIREDSYSDLSGARIVLIDDEPDMHGIIGALTESTGSHLTGAETLEAAKKILCKETFDIAVVDMVLPDARGLDIIKYIREEYSDMSIVVVTGHADQKMAYQLECAGVQNVLTKPFSGTQFKFTLCKEMARRNLLSREGILYPDASEGELGLIGSSEYMQALRNKIRMFSQGNLPVLISGPTGTGKEIIASAIHSLSARSAKSMMIVNSAAIPEHLEESEFFGHAKGAFTGAHEEKCGIIECASGSSLFLDEVGELSLRMQAKLLRVLDGYGYLRVGESSVRPTNFRCISATNRLLPEMIKEGMFREDLYFRLKSGCIETLPLAAHKEDIPALVKHFLYEAGKRDNVGYIITGKALGVLLAYDWPGNIRELKNVIESLCVINRKSRTIVAESIEWAVSGVKQEASLSGGSFQDAKNDFEKKYYRSLLVKHNGNISACAAEAGIDRPNFSRKLKSIGIDASKYKI